MVTVITFLGLTSVTLTGVLATGLLLRAAAGRDAVARYRIGTLTLLATAVVLLAPLIWPQSRSLEAPKSAIPTPVPAEQVVPSAPRLTEPLGAATLRAAGSSLSSESWRDTLQGWDAIPRPSRAVAGGILVVYLIGLLAWSVHYGRRVEATWRLLRAAAPTQDEAVQTLVAETQQRIGGRRRVRVLQTDRVQGTACTGLWRPTLLLPATHDATPTDLQLAVLHELIHLQRRDLWIALGQATLQLLCWFHPLVWVFNHWFDQDRETSCDALVVRMTKQAQTYGTTLLNFFEATGGTPRRYACHAFLHSDSSRFLTRRLKMLRHATHRASLLFWSLATSVGLATLIVCFAVQTVSFAQLEHPNVADPAGNITEIQAPPGDRSDAAVGRKWRDVANCPEFEHLRFLFDENHRPDGPLRDQESLVSTERGRVEGQTLRARHVHVNLPEGSKLYARLQAPRIQMQPEDGGAQLQLEAGSVSVYDDTQIERLRVRTAGDGRLHASMRLENDEVNFQFTAIDAQGEPMDVEIDMDFESGIPRAEQTPPHGSVRYAVLGADDGDWGNVVVKMQWIYDILKLRQASM